MLAIIFLMYVYKSELYVKLSISIIITIKFAIDSSGQNSQPTFSE